MICPGCGVAQMEQRRLDALYGGSLEIDLCHSCHCLWFDGHESLQLSPNATMQLFRVIHEKHEEIPHPLQDVMKCPRCAAALKLTHDLQRGIRFTYYRCPNNHGRQTPFFQFLKEKNLIKPLDAKALAELRTRVQVVRCSNCGAPVDIMRGAACAHCQAVVSALDPDQVQKTLQQLQAHDQKRQNVNPDVAARLIMDRLQTDGFYQRLDASHPRRRSVVGGRFDLVTEGISALVDLLT